MKDVFENASSLIGRLRDVDEVNALIVRREAADWIEKLVRVASACRDLPLWKMEQYDSPREDFEAVTRLRDALDGLPRGSYASDEEYTRHVFGRHIGGEQ